MANEKKYQPTNSLEQAVVNFLEDVFASRTDEIQCDIAENLIGQCAAENFTDDKARQRYPQLFYHFQFCPDCEEVYEMVVGYARDRSAGLVEQPLHPTTPLREMPGKVVSLPPVPTYAPGFSSGSSYNSGIWAKAAKAVKAISSLVESGELNRLSVRRGIQLTENDITLTMEGDEVAITLHVKKEASNENSRRLICNVKATDDLKSHLRDAPIELILELDGSVVQEKALRRTGDVTFTQVKPNTYRLRWTLANQEYEVSELEIL
jgi:hypothetical protein